MPKALVCFVRDDHAIVVTIGVVLRRQPNIEPATDARVWFRDIELGWCFPSDGPRGYRGVFALPRWSIKAALELMGVPRFRAYGVVSSLGEFG